MISWITSTRLHLVHVVLLISIILTGCGQSISHDGESIDSVSSRNGTDGVAQGSETLGDQLPRDVDQQRTLHEQQDEPDSKAPPGSHQLQDQGSTEDVASSDRSVVDDTSSEEAIREQPDIEVPAQKLSDGQIQSPQGSSDEVTASQDQPTVSEVEERKDDTASAGNEEEGSANQQGDEPSSSTSSNSSNNEKKKQSEWDGDNTLTFGELYASVGVRGIVLSEKVDALTDQEVEMSGYMAPPLTAGVRFFVLTKTLMAVCPFCSTDADWPTDIVVVYLPDGEEMNPTEHPVKVTGTLDTGSFRDEDTGFVSLVRIYADKVEVLR